MRLKASGQVEGTEWDNKSSIPLRQQRRRPFGFYISTTREED